VEPGVDPIGPSEGTLRVYRGGSWASYGRGVRSAARDVDEPGGHDFNVGFRLSLGQRIHRAG
jgi:formylglycine-generating enzyme